LRRRSVDVFTFFLFLDDLFHFFLFLDDGQFAEFAATTVAIASGPALVFSPQNVPNHVSISDRDAAK
jgi:hypothetical protein